MLYADLPLHDPGSRWSLERFADGKLAAFCEPLFLCIMRHNPVTHGGGMPDTMHAPCPLWMRGASSNGYTASDARGTLGFGAKEPPVCI
jgi:hypothetical protein